MSHQFEPRHYERIRPVQPLICRAVGCGVDLHQANSLMCAYHWNLVSQTTQRAFMKVSQQAGLGNVPPSEAYMAAARRAIDEVAHSEERYARTQKGLF